MTTARRVARRLLEVFDWRTFAVAGVFAAVLLVGFLVYSAFAAAHDATDAANRRGAAATRRIDLLNSEIQQLQQQIAKGADQRGQLAAVVAALAQQVRQLGGTPVATATTVVTVVPAPRPSTPSPSPRPTATRKPRPHPKPHHTPTPSPSPTCTRLVGILC